MNGVQGFWKPLVGASGAFPDMGSTHPLNAPRSRTARRREHPTALPVATGLSFACDPAGKSAPFMTAVTMR